VNVAPPPSPGLSARTDPACNSASPFTIASPRPSPPALRSSVRSDWLNGSNRRASISGSIPAPVSRIARTARPAGSGATAADTCPPRGVNLRALVSRLSSTWASRVGSPLTHTGASGVLTASPTPLAS
jgi:hypothetical protein